MVAGCSDAERAQASREPEPDIAWIEPGFAIGSCPYAEHRRPIYEQGIRVVIALHEPHEAALVGWDSLGVEFVSLPTRDWVAIPSATFDRVVELVASCLDAGKPVLLHCLAGVNRAPTLAAAVLCRRGGLSVDDAIRAVRRARPTASPTPEQAASLRKWFASRRSLT